MTFESDWSKTVVCILPTRSFTQSAKVWPWPLTPWPKIKRVPPNIIHNLHAKFESDWAKPVVCIASTRQSATDGRTHPLTYSPNHTRTAALLYPLKRCCEGIITKDRTTSHFYTPRNQVRGGILESPCPSVRLSSAFGFPVHNCFPFTPTIMKLHMQTSHESRMCPTDFEVKRSKVKVTMHKLLKMVSGA